MYNIILDRVEVKNNRVDYHFSYSKELTPYFTTNVMFVEYDRDVTSVAESILTIPFVGSIIALSWLTNSVLWVKDIDRTYYEGLTRLKIAYQELYPHCKLGGRFVAANVTECIMSAEPNKALILFSGGLDAHTSYIRNADKNLLLCNIQGWYNHAQDVITAADADFRDIRNFALKHRREYAFVKSNFAQLVDNKYFGKKLAPKLGDQWWHGFQHSMAFKSIAIPIATSLAINEIIIASSFWIGANGSCASYATTDIEFKYCGSGHVKHDVFELKRQDKIRTIVEFQRASGHPYPIRVCSFNDHNCCHCEKCFRTIIGLIAEGADLSDFGFYINGPVKKYYAEYIPNNFQYFGVEHEATVHWPSIKERMVQNYDNIQDKEFIDWFLTYDFIGERKKAIRRYRVRNFFKLIRKRLSSR